MWSSELRLETINWLIKQHHLVLKNKKLLIYRANWIGIQLNSNLSYILIALLLEKKKSQRLLDDIYIYIFWWWYFLTSLAALQEKLSFIYLSIFFKRQRYRVGHGGKKKIEKIFTDSSPNASPTWTKPKPGARNFVCVCHKGVMHSANLNFDLLLSVMQTVRKLELELELEAQLKAGTTTWDVGTSGALLAAHTKCPPQEHLLNRWYLK